MAALPITYVERSAVGTLPDVLLIYGDYDYVVESCFGKRLYNVLIESGSRAVWVNVPWAEHTFDKLFNGFSNQMVLPFIERSLEQTLKKR